MRDVKGLRWDVTAWVVCLVVLGAAGCSDSRRSRDRAKELGVELGGTAVVKDAATLSRSDGGTATGTGVTRRSGPPATGAGLVTRGAASGPPGPKPRCRKRTSKKGDCCIGYAPRPKRDRSAACFIAPGTFTRGSEKLGAARPVEKVTITRGFYLDQYPVTNDQYVRFLAVLGDHKKCPSAYQSLCIRTKAEGRGDHLPIGKKNGRYYVERGLGRHPARSVSREGAERYCQWLGKRLPTEAEWEFAARHDPKTGKDSVYPWGDTFKPNHASCDEEECKDGFEETSPVGIFDGTRGRGDGSSATGVHDLVGNVTEWTSDCYVRKHGWCKVPCVDPVVLPPCPYDSWAAKGSYCNEGSTGLLLAARQPIPLDGYGGYLGVRCAWSP